MKKLFLRLLLATVFISAHFVFAQTQPTPTATPNATFTADYPMDRAGIFVQKSGWEEISNATPSKMKAKHGIAASLSYGAVPARVVAEYEGAHAKTQIEPGTPVICICHMISLPGEPVLVRLHPKKDLRELDGGKMIVAPIVGGSKIADANRSDLIPVDVSHPESRVWLVRSQSPLTAGEYALMLGTQNISIFPFTVTESSTDRATPATQK